MDNYPRRLPLSEYDAVVRRYRSGETYADIGASYGVTRERIRQVLSQHLGPVEFDAIKEAVLLDREQARNERAKAKTFEELMRRVATDRRCLICGSLVLTKPNPDKFSTCDSRCSEVWQAGGWTADPGAYERHRIHVARYILSHPEKHRPRSVKWAEAMLSDNPPPPDRRFSHPSSRMAAAKQVVAFYRGDAFPDSP